MPSLNIFSTFFTFLQKKLALLSAIRYNAPAPLPRRRAKARSGSSVWLERSPVTAEVAGSSPVRFVQQKRILIRVSFFVVYAPALSHHLVK